MTIRTKLLLFVPLLVLLANVVTFFIFQSSTVVQESYDVMMKRVLLYQQSTGMAEQYLQRLYGYMVNPGGAGAEELAATRRQLTELLASLGTEAASTRHLLTFTNFTNMFDTLLAQENNAMWAARNETPSAALVHYEKAEQTTGFIREEGQHLVDLELSDYQPVYQRIRTENARMNRLATVIFGTNTLLSIVLAVWISRSITTPVSGLVTMARQIAQGRLQIKPLPRSNDELGILSDTFRRMTEDLRSHIAKEKESMEKDRLVKELELKALQSQINPHFLFNTLNVLSKLALIEGAGQTSDLIVSVSNLLRYNLRKLDQPVTLRDELQYLKEYIAIQQARFRDRIRVELQVDESALNQAIPALTLQPLAENAFVHGVAEMESGAFIRLEITRVSEGVRMVLSDNGKGMTEEVRQSLLRLEGAAESANSTGLGTRNVFKRLQLFYGYSNLVDIDSAPGEGTVITILLPHTQGGELQDVPVVDRG